MSASATPSPRLVSADEMPHALLRAGLIPSRRFLDAADAVRDGARWRRWGQGALLAVAVGQLLAGIVFFFAFNWAALPPFAKLGLVQAGIVACVAGAWFARGRRAAWEALLTAAVLLVGVLLAVFGQIYQTGADAWTLFAGWGLLILPWVALGRALAPWILWLAVASLGGVAYAVQIALPMGWILAEAVAALLALFVSVALLLRELGAQRGLDWLQPLWPRWLLVAAILAITFAAATPAVFEDKPEPAGWMSIGLFAAAAAGLGVAARWRRDLPAAVLSILAGSLFLAMCGARTAFDSFEFIGGSFVFLAIVLAVFGGALALLRRIQAGMAGDA